MCKVFDIESFKIGNDIKKDCPLTFTFNPHNCEKSYFIFLSVIILCPLDKLEQGYLVLFQKGIYLLKKIKVSPLSPGSKGLLQF